MEDFLVGFGGVFVGKAVDVWDVFDAFFGEIIIEELGELGV